MLKRGFHTCDNAKIEKLDFSSEKPGIEMKNLEFSLPRALFYLYMELMKNSAIPNTLKMVLVVFSVTIRIKEDKTRTGWASVRLMWVVHS